MNSRIPLLSFFVALTLLVCIAPAPAQATTFLSNTMADILLNYTIVQNSNTYSFDLSSKPVVAPDNADPGFGFGVTSIDLTVNGVADTTDNEVMFYEGGYTPMGHTIIGAGGGLLACSSSNDCLTPLFDYLGPQLYTGSENSPNMSLFPPKGEVTLYDYNTYKASSLTITPVNTPEPKTIVLLALFLPLGLAFKRQ